jgi:hypothetical protein
VSSSIHADIGSRGHHQIEDLVVDCPDGTEKFSVGPIKAQFADGIGGRTISVRTVDGGLYGASLDSDTRSGGLLFIEMLGIPSLLAVLIIAISTPKRSTEPLS